jgi:bacteriocin-like protein
MNQFKILTKSQMNNISGGKNIWYWIGYVIFGTAASHAKTLENLGTDACNAAVMYN